MGDLTTAVADTVERLVMTYPDAIYNGRLGGCSYVNRPVGDGVGCIFGQALVACGVSSHVLHRWEVKRARRGKDTSITDLCSDLLGIEAMSWWKPLQGLQDNRVSWGKSYALSHVLAPVYERAESVGGAAGVMRVSGDMVYVGVSTPSLTCVLDVSFDATVSDVVDMLDTLGL